MMFNIASLFCCILYVYRAPLIIAQQSRQDQQQQQYYNQEYRQQVQQQINQENEQETANRWHRNLPVECRSCNPEECKVLTGCVAGTVKDSCGCCDICGKSEYELCDHPQAPHPKPGGSYGKCGQNLECNIRNDLIRSGEKQVEAICYCRSKETICGSDSQTYENMCQLTAASVVKRIQITVASEGPCVSSAKIVSPPENVKNSTGANIAILCEARGFPIPNIEWTFTRVDGQTIPLPSDDQHISLNMRGGPEKYQITGWLQISELMKEHEGDYTCIAQNAQGFDKASARINVMAKDAHGKDSSREYL